MAFPTSWPPFRVLGIWKSDHNGEAHENGGMLGASSGAKDADG